MKNYILKILLSIILAFSVIGCGGGSSDGDEDIGSNSDSTIDSGNTDDGNIDDESDKAYLLKKDESNKIVMEKTIDGDFIVTEMKDGKYVSTKILASGDTNVFEIAYQADGVQLIYKGETELVTIDDTIEEQEIESQYIGMWREDVDENWVGDIDIAYIYTDKAIVFTANIATDACSQLGTLNVSEFQSLLKNDIDVNNYVIATTYKSRIETACGSYALLNSSLRKERLFDWFETSKEERDEDLESNTDDAIDHARLGWLVDPNLLNNIVNKINDKVDEISDKVSNWAPVKAVKWIYDATKPAPKTIVIVDGTNSTYDQISSKNSSNDISGIRDSIDDFEDNSYIDNGSPFEDSTFMYAENDENGEIEVTESISYDSYDKKVEEIPNYDENGEIISITKRTYLGDDAFGTAYEEETVEVDNNTEENPSTPNETIGYWFDYSFDGISYEDRTHYISIIQPDEGELYLLITAETANGQNSTLSWRNIPIGDLQIGETVTVTETKTNYEDFSFTYYDNGTQVGKWQETGDNNGDMSFEVRRESDGYYFDFTIILQPDSYMQSSTNKTLEGQGFISNDFMN